MPHLPSALRSTPTCLKSIMYVVHNINHMLSCTLHKRHVGFLSNGTLTLPPRCPHALPGFMLHCTTAITSVQVIADITRRMGSGMAKYIERDVETVADYDEYCHFVAGLVGIGLSQVLITALAY